MSILSGLRKEIAEIDILSSPPNYITGVMRLICDGLGYRFGSVIEIGDQGKGKMLSSYNLPKGYPEQASRLEAPLLSSPSGEAIETGRIVILHHPLSDPRMASKYKVKQARAAPLR